jgi:hypothetical protein
MLSLFVVSPQYVFVAFCFLVGNTQLILLHDSANNSAEKPIGNRSDLVQV